MWVLGILFSLLKGVCTNPWGIDLFDLDLLTILTAYLFLSFGRIQAGAFALGQGLFIDIFSSGLHGLFTSLYLSVFLGICLNSLFFNLRTAKGQMIIVSLTVLLKYVVSLAILTLFTDNVVFSRTFLYSAALSIIGSGLMAPIFFALFNRLSGIPAREAGSPSPEEL